MEAVQVARRHEGAAGKGFHRVREAAMRLAAQVRQQRACTTGEINDPLGFDMGFSIIRPLAARS